MDDVTRALAKKMTQSAEVIYIAVKSGIQKLSKYYTEDTPMTGLLIILGHMLDPFRKLRCFEKWDKGMDIHPEDETSYTTQYQQDFLKYVENEYCARHNHVLVTKPRSIVNNNLVCSGRGPRSGRSCDDTDDFSSDDVEYLMPNNVVEITAR